MNWKPVSELPPEYKDILVFVPSQSGGWWDRAYAYRDSGDEMVWWCDGDAVTPTHWCEIPKVPQVEPIRDDS